MKEQQSCEQLELIARKHLVNWPLFEETHHVSSLDIGDKKLWLGYRSNQTRAAFAGSTWDTTHFDVNVIDNVFYVLGIGVSQEHRGKGHGHKLYQILESIAKEFGCEKIQMTPSGHTKTGETRKNYMLRRGYDDLGMEVFKKL